MRREFDGVIEREHMVAITGSPLSLSPLESAVVGLIVMAKAVEPSLLTITLGTPEP
jgi:hypothetical protein